MLARFPKAVWSAVRPDTGSPRCAPPPLMRGRGCG